MALPVKPIRQHDVPNATAAPPRSKRQHPLCPLQSRELPAHWLHGFWRRHGQRQRRLQDGWRVAV